MGNTQRLKEAGTSYERIFEKKDVCSSARNEWKRLRDVDTAQKEWSENVGYVIRLDTRERKVYQDSIDNENWQQALSEATTEPRLIICHGLLD